MGSPDSILELTQWENQDGTFGPYVEILHDNTGLSMSATPAKINTEVRVLKERFEQDSAAAQCALGRLLVAVEN